MRAKAQARKLEKSEGESESDYTSSGDSVHLESDSLEDQGDGEGVEDSAATSVAMETPSKLTLSNSSIGGLMPSSLYVLDQSIMPSELYLGQSQCPSQEVTALQRLGLGLGLTLGVWTKVKIPSGTHFGPFIGKIRPLPLDRQFAWEIAQVADVHGSCSMWVDATEPGIGNWMKYVRTASHLSLRNMKAVLLNSQVYYRATKDICEGEELLLKDRKLIPGGQRAKSHQEDVTSSSVVPPTLPENRPPPSETLSGGPTPSFSSPSSINNNNNDNSSKNNNNNNNNEPRTPSSTSVILHQRPEVEKEEGNPPQSPPATSPLLLPPSSSATSGLAPTTALHNHSPNSNSSGSEGRTLYLGQRRQGQRTEGEENDAEDEDEEDDEEEEEEEEEEEDEDSITPRSSHNEDSKPLTNNLTSADSNEAEFKDRFLHGLECAACCQSFSDVAKLEEHLVLVHYARESGLGEYKCDQCPKIFSWKSNLLRHQSTHEDGRRYNCENCHKIFTDPSNLQRHIRSQHIGARSHACPECGKTFATSSGLKQHTHIHSSVKPFQCEVCLKSYTQFSNLCRHKRMHADCRMQIKCHKCGQAFSTVTSLSKHKRFCEGPSSGSAPLANGLLNLAHPGSDDGSLAPPSMNLSHPAQLMFYPRPGFPFYPPSMVAYPMFPGAGAVAPHPSLVSANGNLYVQTTTSAAKKPDSPDSSAAALNGSTGKPEVLGLLSHKEKRGSEGSESEISDELSSAGACSDDVDVSTGSELDSESDAGERRGLKSQAAKKSIGSATMPNLFVPRRENSPKQGATYPSDPAMKSPHQPANGLSVNCDMPFDLSVNSKTAHMSPASSDRNGKDEEQPLDLRVVHKRSTPHVDHHPRHKTHVFGERHRVKEERPATVVPQQQHHEKPPPPSMIAHPPPAVANVPVFSEPPPSPTKFPMACPRPIHPLMMEALYRMDKPKFPGFPTPERMIPAFPARYPFLNPLMNLNGSSAALDILRSQMEKMGKPYHDVLSPHMNKLKERYSCKFCGKIFPRSANLTRHLRTHTGEQPYKCKYCERSFSISSNLQRHVRNIHNKEKPFKCPLCDRCFGQQTNLDRHLKKHESDGPTILDDSPKSSELNDKDDTYFDEIRNFIGKVTERDTQVLMPSQVLGGPLYEKMDCNNPPSRTPEHIRPILKTERMDDNEMTDDDEDVKPSPVKRRHVSSEGEGTAIRSPGSCNDGELPINGLQDSKAMAYEAMMKVSKRHPKDDELEEEEDFRKRRNVHRMESTCESQSEDGKDAPLKTEA